jgi:hypothetical protein
MMRVTAPLLITLILFSLAPPVEAHELAMPAPVDQYGVLGAAPALAATVVYVGVMLPIVFLQSLLSPVRPSAEPALVVGGYGPVVEVGGCVQVWKPGYHLQEKWVPGQWETNCPESR